METELVELKSCPFCGGEASMTALPKEWESDNDGRFLVECLNCGANAPSRGTTEAKAAAAWNTRAAIAAIDESRSVSVEDEAAALVMLANEFNIPPDVQEVLVRGSLSRNIKPGALKSLLAMKPLPAPPYGGVE